MTVKLDPPVEYRKGDQTRTAYTPDEAVLLRSRGYQPVDGPTTGNRVDATSTVDGDSTAADLDHGAGDDVPVPPPMGGAGSGTAEWLEYAETFGMTFPDETTRSEVIDALKEAGHPVE